MADKWKSERNERTTNRESDERVRSRADEYDDTDEFDDATEDQDEIDETDEEGTTV
jgi:hypothetical protein